MILFYTNRIEEFETAKVKSSNFIFFKSEIISFIKTLKTNINYYQIFKSCPF